MKKTTGRSGMGRGIFLFLLLAGMMSFAQTTDVYFVGNSYTATYDVPTVFKNLSTSGGHASQIGQDIIGGAELVQHWATGTATNAIAATSYDYVVLQESSVLAYDTTVQAGFATYAPLFDQAITNSGAQTMLYMTWVREDQLDNLTNGIAIYRNMAKQLGCKVSPVGEAWRRVRQQYPAIDTYGPDRTHPSEKGAYLAACNFYGAIFNETPEGLPMRTVGGTTLDAADAAVLQRIAWDAVNFVSYTNPPVITSMTVDQAVRTNSTPFTFYATATDNGSITDYMWNFGDGITTNGSALTNVTHTYTNDGIFLVTVKVTDDSGETERTGLSVTRDTTGPQISSIAAASQMLTVRFNQDIQQTGAETATNYTISGGGAISVISATQSTSNVVRLEVSALAAGVEYTLTVNNLYNMLGVKIYPNTTKDFTYVDGSNMHLRFDFGDTNYPTAGNWNNVTSVVLGVVITNAIDIYGVPRNIGLRLLGTTLPGYSWGYAYSNLYPATAQRDNIAVGKKFSYQIEGADPSAEYRLTFFASKVAASRETVYTVGTSNVVLDCAYNSNRTAVIDGIKSDASGNIVFSLNTNMNSSGFAYLSVLELQDTTPPVIKNIETDTGSLDITEGTTSNIQVRLTSQPLSNVTVSVNASGYAHVQVLSESAFIYFDTNNWNAWQPVYVQALTDADTDGGTAIIQLADVGDIYASTNVSATQIDTTVPSETAIFSATPTSGWSPLTVTFTDQSTVSGVTGRFWSFGDGSTTNTTATNVTHTYTAGGTNTVQLIVSGSITSSTNTQVGLIVVTVPVVPSAGFTVSTNAGTVPLAVTFTDTSTGDITNRFWDFGDGVTTNTTATSVAHTYTTAGTNTVQLIVTGPGGVGTNIQVAAVTVTLPVAPVASFNASPTSGTAPLLVSFTDTSTGTITNRFWSFGDGTVTNTTATSVAHTYSAAGTNTAQLVVSGPAGAGTNVVTISVVASQATLVNLDLSAAYNYDAFATGDELAYIQGLSGTNRVLYNTIGGHNISADLTAGMAHLVTYGLTATYTNYTNYKGLTTNTVKNGYYELAAGLTTNKFGTSSGTTSVSNSVYVRNLALTNSVTINFAAANQLKYSNLNVLVNGLRYTTNSLRRCSADISVKYVGDSSWYTLWSESVGAGTNGGCFGKDLLGAGYASSAWSAVNIDPAGSGVCKTTGGFSQGAAASSGTFAYELANALVLDPTKTLESIKLTAISDDASALTKANTFILYAITASKTASASESAPAITSALTATGTVGQAFSYQITASNSPTSFAATGLPTGLNIDTNSGAITGTPTVEGSNNVTISASNSGGTDSKTLVVVISPVPVDGNGNGIPDSWENQYGITNSNPNAPSANGINTILESYIAGLNPTNPTARLNLSIQPLAAQKLFQWQSVSGRVYSVYWTTNLLTGFQSLETNIAWPQSSWTDTVHGAQGGGFYQIKVRLGQ